MDAYINRDVKAWFLPRSQVMTVGSAKWFVTRFQEDLVSEQLIHKCKEDLQEVTKEWETSMWYSFLLF